MTVLVGHVDELEQEIARLMEQVVRQRRAIMEVHEALSDGCYPHSERCLRAIDVIRRSALEQIEAHRRRRQAEARVKSRD